MAIKICDEKARESLGMNLQLMRKINDISISELAEMIGVSAQTLKKYETGKSVPDAFVIYNLADVYGTTVENLFSNKLENAWYEFLEKIKS